MDQNFGIKELYEACFKTTKQVKIGTKTYEAGEPILFFENINLAKIDLPVATIIASGGKGNYPLVYWEDEQEKTLQMQNGLLSKMSFALLSGTNALVTLEPVVIPKNEMLQTNGSGNVTLFDVPKTGTPIFVYKINDDKSREKITEYSLADKILQTSLLNQELFVSYYYVETEGETSYELGLDRLSNFFFTFEGKMYYKDENEGINKTCVITIPRLKIVSDLTLTIGEKASPVVANFSAIVFPVDENRKKISMKFFYLNRDIDYDF